MIIDAEYQRENWLMMVAAAASRLSLPASHDDARRSRPRDASVNHSRNQPVEGRGEGVLDDDDDAHGDAVAVGCR